MSNYPVYYGPVRYGGDGQPMLGDPLSFFQKTAKEMQVDLEFDREMGIGIEDELTYFNGCFEFLKHIMGANEKDNHCLHIDFVYIGDKTDLRKSGLRKFTKGKADPTGKRIRDFDIRTDNLSWFERYRDQIGIIFQYYRYKPEPQQEVWATLACEPLKGGNYKVSRNLGFEAQSVTGIPLDPADPLACQDILNATVHSGFNPDYRPFIYRMLEVFDNRPSKRYEAVGKSLDEVVDTSVALLFSGDERQTIEQKLAAARLQQRRNWASVPRLNLGNIKLPDKGNRDVTKDAFVVDAAPLLIEQLVYANIMSPEEAERVVTTRLGNYFVHKAGFQLSTGRARTIIEQLRQQEGKPSESVSI